MTLLSEEARIRLGVFAHQLTATRTLTHEQAMKLESLLDAYADAIRAVGTSSPWISIGKNTGAASTAPTGANRRSFSH